MRTGSTSGRLGQLVVGDSFGADGRPSAAATLNRKADIDVLAAESKLGEGDLWQAGAQKLQKAFPMPLRRFERNHNCSERRSVSKR